MKVSKKKKKVLTKNEMRGIWPIQLLVELALWSSYVKFGRIVSLLIVAEPESGKTELLKKYRRNKGVQVRRRFSAYGILKDLREARICLLFEKPKILGHIILYDFVALFSFKASTVNSTMAFLDGFTEEGVESESTYAVNIDDTKKFAGVKGGIIAAINTHGFFTPNGKRKITANLMKGGFFSRNLIVSYSIPDSLVKEIFDNIIERNFRADREFVNLITLDLPARRRCVEIAEAEAQELEKMVFDIKNELKDYLGQTVKGIRLFKSLITLAKASALRDGRYKVNSDDIETIRFLSNWMNLRMNSLKAKYQYL